MTLHYTDLTSTERLEPVVSTSDVHMNPKAHATTSLSPRAVGTSGGKVVTKNDTVMVYDSSNQRIVIGRLPDGSYGVAVSKPGYNVSDAFA